MAGCLRSRRKVEAAVHTDPRTACFYARRALELAVAWTYKHDPARLLARPSFARPDRPLFPLGAPDRD